MYILTLILMGMILPEQKEMQWQEWMISDWYTGKDGSDRYSYWEKDGVISSSSLDQIKGYSEVVTEESVMNKELKPSQNLNVMT